MPISESAGGVVGNSGVGQKFLSLVLSPYIVTIGLAATYYNWEYARTHGFLPWVFFGEIVPTAKALVWPYFTFHKGDSSGASNPVDAELKKTALTPSQIAEMEAKKLILAINYSQQATYLLNSAPHENLADYPNLSHILAYRRKAIQVGRSVNTDVLNGVYPELGDRFRSEFVEAISLFVHGSDTQSDDELRRSKLLNDEWADWYEGHRKAIEDAINKATGAG
jgi:hypothetical protein